MNMFDPAIQSAMNILGNLEEINKQRYIELNKKGFYAPGSPYRLWVPDEYRREYEEERIKESEKADWEAYKSYDMIVDKAGLKKRKKPWWVPKCIKKWPQGRLNVYIASIAIDDDHEDPMTINVYPFKRARRGQDLSISDNLQVYTNKAEGVFPRYIKYQVYLIRSRKGLRQRAEIIDEVRKNKTFNSIKDILGNVIKSPIPGVPNLVKTATEVALDGGLTILSESLKLKEDDWLVSLSGYVNRDIDNLGLDEEPFFEENECGYLIVKPRIA